MIKLSALPLHVVKELRSEESVTALTEKFKVAFTQLKEKEPNLFKENVTVYAFLDLETTGYIPRKSPNESILEYGIIYAMFNRETNSFRPFFCLQILNHPVKLSSLPFMIGEDEDLREFHKRTGLIGDILKLPLGNVSDRAVRVLLSEINAEIRQGANGHKGVVHLSGSGVHFDKDWMVQCLELDELVDLGFHYRILDTTSFLLLGAAKGYPKTEAPDDGTIGCFYLENNQSTTTHHRSIADCIRSINYMNAHVERYRIPF